MIKFGMLAIVALAISVMFMGLYSCKKAEEAGKDVEKVGEETTEKVEKAGEKKVEEPVKKLEKTAKDVKDVLKK
jgi:hypothetical protein